MRIQYGHFLTLFAVIAIALASSVEDVLVSIDLIFLEIYLKYLIDFYLFNFFRVVFLPPSWITS